MAQKVTHVIFDMDGTLLGIHIRHFDKKQNRYQFRHFLDTERLYSIAYNKVLFPFNKSYDWKLKPLIMGSQQLDACQKIIDFYSLPIDAQDFSQQLKDHAEVMMIDAQLMPGLGYILLFALMLGFGFSFIFMR